MWGLKRTCLPALTTMDACGYEKRAVGLRDLWGSFALDKGKHRDRFGVAHLDGDNNDLMARQYLKTIGAQMNKWLSSAMGERRRGCLAGGGYVNVGDRGGRVRARRNGNRHWTRQRRRRSRTVQGLEVIEGRRGSHFCFRVVRARLGVCLGFGCCIRSISIRLDLRRWCWVVAGQAPKRAFLRPTSRQLGALEGLERQWRQATYGRKPWTGVGGGIDGRLKVVFVANSDYYWNGNRRKQARSNTSLMAQPGMRSEIQVRLDPWGRGVASLIWVGFSFVCFFPSAVKAPQVPLRGLRVRHNDPSIHTRTPLCAQRSCGPCAAMKPGT